MSKKKLTLKKRLYNMWTWLKSPIFLLCTVVSIGLFTLVLVLANPCGKFSHAIHGVCSGGNEFMSPLVMSILAVIISLPIVLLAFSNTQNDASSKPGKVNIAKGIQKHFRHWPKWRQKWYLPSFIISYALVAIVFYSIDKDGGLRWYHYVGQFAIVAPFLALFLADRLLTIARKVFKIK